MDQSSQANELIRSAIAEPENSVLSDSASEFLSNHNMVGNTREGKALVRQLETEGVLPQLLIQELDNLDIDGNDKLTKRELELVGRFPERYSPLTLMAGDFAFKRFKDINAADDLPFGVFDDGKDLNKGEVQAFADANPQKELDALSDSRGARLLHEEKLGLDLDGDEKITKEDLEFACEASDPESSIHKAAQFALDNFAKISKADDLLMWDWDSGELSLNEIDKYFEANGSSEPRVHRRDHAEISGLDAEQVDGSTQVAAATEDEECATETGETRSNVAPGVVTAVEEAARTAASNLNPISAGSRLGEAILKLGSDAMIAATKTKVATDTPDQVVPEMKAEMINETLANLVKTAKAGQTKFQVLDARGQKVDATISYEPVAPGSDRHYLVLWTDINGRKSPVMRAIEENGRFEQQQSADGQTVDWLGSAWTELTKQ